MEAERVVEFFFAPGSRYSYLAASQIPRIEADTGCRFDWLPVRGTQIRALRGRDPFEGEPISGQYDWSYRRRDAEMWAEYYGITFREPPNHELDFDLLARAAAAGVEPGVGGVPALVEPALPPEPSTHGVELVRIARFHGNTVPGASGKVPPDLPQKTCEDL